MVFDNSFKGEFFAVELKKCPGEESFSFFFFFFLIILLIKPLINVLTFWIKTRKEKTVLNIYFFD